LETIEEIANSRARLTIASLLSVRPRTLSELAETTGISVQAVLKHLKKLAELGILETRGLPSGRHLRNRKLYFINSRKVADYSAGDMIVATLGREAREGETAGTTNAYAELDSLAQDVILLRSRAREVSERMKRMIEEATEDESRISRLIEGLNLSPEDKQIAYLIFGDDRPEQARRSLRKHYGCKDPDGAIREVVERMKGAGV